ncbi:MAG: DUF305 domain-containing protein [Synechococcales cyanobacterium CRU_2_2]|nr:DUF305 domain-containing protein [Synechococcales cyanobacterium CRU_2_2]
MAALNPRSLSQTIVFPFVAYLLLFVGMGFVAGSIVHFGEVAQIRRFAAIGAVGMVMFVVGSYWQEIHVNPQTLPKQELLRYVLYSLLLAVGIGMMSGGTQHFLDFPRYASFLLPGGLLIAIIGYVLRNAVTLSRRAWALLLSGTLAIALPLFLGLNHYAQGLPAASGHGHGMMHESSNARATQPTGAPLGGSHGHGTAIATDLDFLEEMIPHHQEAVDTSAYLLTRTSDQGLQTFLRGVIDVQAQEVNQMKQWYQQWFSKPYAPSGTYETMIGSLPQTEGAALERAYLQGMVAHHQGAIAMAQQIKTRSQRPELKQMAAAIVMTQTKEVGQLEHWLGERATGSSSHQH